MKKKFLGLSILVLLAMNLYGGAFSDLANSINAITDSGEVEFVECKLPNGREIFPVVWNFTNCELQSEDKKVLSQEAELAGINLFNKAYKINYAIVFKFGLGIQRQEAVLLVNEDEGNFYVGTESLVVYNVNRKGEKTSGGSNMSASSRKAVAKQISESLNLLGKGLSDEDYAATADKAIYNLETFSSINATAKNALIAKKWHKEHDGKDKIFSVSSMGISKVDLSDKKDFEYKITGFYFIGGKDVLDVNTVFINFYTNDDKYAELSEKDTVSVSGVVDKISFDDLLRPPYGITGITLLDK